MTYQTRVYERPAANGFPPEPVAVVVAEGTHDVSRLLHLFSYGNCEHVQVGQQLLRQTLRGNSGRDALALLRQHGGPDLTRLEPDATDPDGVGYWGSTEAHFISAGPNGQVDLSFAGSPRVDPAAARRLADQLYAAADHAERAMAAKVVSGPLGHWKACTDPAHTAPVDDTLDWCSEHDTPVVPVNAAGYEVVQ